LLLLFHNPQIFKIYKKKKKTTTTKTQQSKYLQDFDVESLSMTQSKISLFYKNISFVTKTNIITIAVGDMTLMNTKLEVSMPGFMNIDYLNQIRKEEKIGGGGCAVIYRGVILDSSLKEVFFLVFFFNLFNRSFFKKP